MSQKNENFTEISENFKKITENVNQACSNCGRRDEIRIMAVTKGVSYEKVNHAISCGIDLLGENRAQEFLQKEPFYTKNAKKIEIHFIGGLQNNKIKYIIDKVGMIQSIDSIKLASEINKRALAHSLVMDVLLEVNIGDEDSKHGISAESLSELIAQTDELENIRLRGLMAIPPYGAEEQMYADMQRLYNDAKARVKQPDGFDTLSMGMSGDYKVAIKHGANIIRIGSALFGSR
jgi:hypothetical protein